MGSIWSWFPQQEGLLPKFLMFIALIAMGNSIQAFLTLEYTSQVYSGPTVGAKSPATELSGRTFGTWTFVTALIRLHAAYHINEPAWYDIATWTFAVAGFHFVSEWLYFKTTRWQKGLIGPIIVFNVGLTWMTLQRGFYLGK